MPSESEILKSPGFTRWARALHADRSDPRALSPSVAAHPGERDIYIYIYISTLPALSLPASPASPPARALRLAPMLFESHFKSYFGNVKAFILKKFKIIAEPVAAMAAGGPAAGGRRQANSLGRA